MYTGNVKKTPFLFWLLLIDGAVDQSETPLILKLRPSSVYQGAIYQFWSSGFDDTWRQPKGVELGIQSHADYIVVEEVDSYYLIQATWYGNDALWARPGEISIFLESPLQNL